MIESALPVIAYLGEDQITLEEVMRQDAHSWVADDPLATEVIHVSEQSNPEEAVDKILEALATQSLFSEKKALIVYEMEKIPASEADPLLNWLKSPQGDTGVFWIFSKLAKNTKLYKALQKVGEIKTFEAPKAWKMGEWVIQRARSYKMNFKKAVADLLLDMVGNDNMVLDRELQKIRDYAPKVKDITADILHECVTVKNEGNIWGFIDAFGRGDSATALKELQRLLNHGTYPLPIHANLTRRVHQLLKARLMMERGATEMDVAQSMGMSDWLFKKNWPPMIKARPTSILSRIFVRLNELEFEMKRGSYTHPREYELAISPFLVGAGR